MRSKFRIAIATSIMAVIGMDVGAVRAGEPDGPALVDALNSVFGKHKARASHAKGLCVKGMFTPTAGAASMSKAALFAKAVPFAGRFSMGGGNPKVPDHAKAAPRGLALKFDLGGGSSSDLVMLSTPMFFAKTPAQVLGFLQARVPGPDGKPDQEKIKAFAAANPETAKQGAWLAGQPVPASYASVNYWAIHAFTLTNAKGDVTTVKFKVVPAAGEAGLTDDEAKTKPADFYGDELKERLSKGPAAFDLVAIIGEKDDPTDDPTAEWPESSRKTVKLGSAAITTFEADAACDAGVFDPVNLADGISGPAKDPIFAVRSPAYAESLTRRSN